MAQQTHRTETVETDAPPLTVDRLSTAEALVVWGLRYWVEAVKAGRDPIPWLLQGFGAGQVEEAVESLDALLTLTLEAATSPRDVRCRGCRGVGDGERDLLAALCLAQRGWELDLRRELSGWLKPQACRLAARLVRDMGQVLGDRGLMVPVREVYTPAAMIPVSEEVSVRVPGSTLLH